MSHPPLPIPAPNQPRYTAFVGERRLASGGLREVVLRVATALYEGGAGEPGPLLVFDDGTGHVVEVDLRGTPDQAAERAATAAAATSHANTSPSDGPAAASPRSPGRPRLGVVSREVTLLPRHWEWLALQPGGASVALRRLVEQARLALAPQDAVRAAQERAYRFLSPATGHLPGFEAAARALFAGDAPGFDIATNPWPADLRDYARRMADGAFGSG